MSDDPEVQQQTPSQEEGGAVTAHVGKFEVTIAQRQLPLVGIFFAAM